MYSKEQIELIDKPMDEFMVEIIAIACHQQNRTYCSMIGDDSQLNWDKSPGWQKESAIDGVRGALISADPEISHESWLAFKKKDGWCYGVVKDIDKKLHPCMVPYNELPEEQRKKDELYITMIQQIGLSAGMVKLR